LDDALNALAAPAPRKAKGVELRFFGGLSVEETAEVLRVSPIIVMRERKSAESLVVSRARRAHHQSRSRSRHRLGPVVFQPGASGRRISSWCSVAGYRQWYACEPLPTAFTSVVDAPTGGRGPRRPLSSGDPRPVDEPEVVHRDWPQPVDRLARWA